MFREDTLKQILILAWPVMITQLLNLLYNLFDAFWLGNLEGVTTIAAIQISWPVFGMLIAIGYGFSTAAVSLVSQYNGANLKNNANFFASQVISITFLISLPLAVIGYLATPTLVYSLGVEQMVAQEAIKYIKIIFLGFPFILITICADGIFRGNRQMVLSMIIIGVSVLLNIVLDPLFIEGYYFFPEMGISGAAVATIIAYAFSSFLFILFLSLGKGGIRISPIQMIPDIKKIKKILKIGVPASIGYGGSSLGFFFLMYIIAMVPNATTALAAYGIGDRLMYMVLIISLGISAASSTLVGEALGENSIEKAKKVVRKALTTTFIITTLFAIFTVIFRAELIGLFLKEEAVILEGSLYIIIFSIGMPFFAIFNIVDGVFAGSGHNTPTMICEILRLILIRIPLSYIFLELGSKGIWISMTISNIIAALLGLALLSTDIWKNKVIDVPPILS